MSSIFNRLASSKFTSYAGAALVVLGTICATMRSDVIDLAPVWGPKLCALLAIVGAFISLFGQGVADRRSFPPEAGGVSGGGISAKASAMPPGSYGRGTAGGIERRGRGKVHAFDDNGADA